MITASAGTGALAGAPGLKEMVYENRASYAQRWGKFIFLGEVPSCRSLCSRLLGYEFMWANITSYDFGAKIYWNKIPILREAFDRFPKAKWIWWLDLDIIIMTPSLDLHTHVLSEEGMLQQMLIDQEIVGVGGGLLGFKSLVDPKPDDMNFVIAQDLWGQNVGSFLMRRGDWSDWVLEMWADPLATAKDWVFPENDGWTHLFKNHQIVRDHTAIVTQRALNAYPDYNELGEHWKDGDLLVHFAGCGSNKLCPVRWNEMWERRESYEVPEVIQQELANGTAKIEVFQKGDLFT